jgi:hypothetical protein
MRQKVLDASTEGRWKLHFETVAGEKPVAAGNEKERGKIMSNRIGSIVNINIRNDMLLQKPKKAKAFTVCGFKVRATQAKLPDGWLGCFIALSPDGSIDPKRSCILKQGGK